MEYFLMQDQQRTLFNFLEPSPSSAYGSLHATPCSNTNPGHYCQQMAAHPAYFVDSPSTTVLDMSSISYEDQKSSERLTEPFTASLLSRSTSFLSNCTSEAVSLPDVSARLQSWCKSRPAPLRMPNKWATCDEEAGLGAEEEDTRSRCCDILKSPVLWSCLTVVLTAFLLALFTSMYWLVCHPHPPSTTFQGVEFRRFNVLQGYDRTGVPTDMVSLESMVRLAYSNPSRHYGAFVSGADVEITYLPRPIVHGQVPGFYQGCHSKRDVIINAIAEYVPLYGAGPSLKQAILENRHIRLGLKISVRSHVNFFGSLVRKHFTEIIACNVLLDPNTGAVVATYCEPPQRQEGEIRHSP